MFGRYQSDAYGCRELGVSINKLSILIAVLPSRLCSGSAQQHRFRYRGSTCLLVYLVRLPLRLLKVMVRVMIRVIFKVVVSFSGFLFYFGSLGSVSALLLS